MCVFVGMLADNGFDAFLHWPSIILAVAGAWALSAAAMMINDYFDLEIDTINRPERPLPSGQIKPKSVLIVSIILVLFGLSAGLGIDFIEYYLYDGVFWVSTVTAIINSILLISYTNYLKRYSILGNFTVSICVWFGFLYGDLIFDFTLNWFPECLGFSAFVLNFGREIAKGIIDIEGDRENEVTTIATLFGKKWTAVIASTFFFLAVGASLIPIFLASASWVYLGSIFVGDILAVVVSIWLLLNQSDKSVIIVKTIVLWIMLLSLVSFTLEAFLGDFVDPIIV
jgi:geranylgeranylglycerol-phosphate geranylgeranyltransferase